MSTFDPEDRYSYVARSEADFDDYSELGPDDSASQIGRAVTTEEQRNTIPRVRQVAGDAYARQWINGSSPPTALKSSQRTDPAPLPSSRRTSMRSSRIITPTTFVPAKRDRVRYSWQSIHGDEPNRPRIHVVKIVSNTATASAGLPGGEAFGFAISPGGRRIACYNSARLFILQAAALPVNISQEYALRRRPVAVEVVDEGGVLAVLADEHTINVYDLSNHRVRRLKTFKTDYPTSVIALSPTGALLAAGYDHGVEVFSLASNALTTDRRAARTEKMDKLQFSEDGSTLIGTTTRVHAAATVFISVPVFPASEDGIATHEELKAAWCTNMLEPINVLDSSHATFLRERNGVSNEKLFAWNATEDTFGILNSQDLQYGNVEFPVTISPPLSTCGGLGAAIHSVPSFDERGETVGMVVNDRTIRLYMVPQPDDETTKVEAHSIDHELDEEFGCPFSDIRWVQSSASLPAPKGDPSQVSGRLVVVSPGGIMDPSTPEDAVVDVEQGRIILFDFDMQYAGQPGQTFTFTLGKAPPQTLDEPEVDVAQEVALIRRRTVNRSQKMGPKGAIVGRTASTMQRRLGDRSPVLTISPHDRIKSPPMTFQDRSPNSGKSPLERSQSQPLASAIPPQQSTVLMHNNLTDVQEANEVADAPTNSINAVTQDTAVAVSDRPAQLPQSTEVVARMYGLPAHRGLHNGSLNDIISPIGTDNELKTPISANGGWSAISPVSRSPVKEQQSSNRHLEENVNHGLTVSAMVGDVDADPRMDSKAAIELREYQRLEQEQQEKLRQRRQDEQIKEQQRLEQERKDRVLQEKDEGIIRMRDRIEQRTRFERRLHAHHAQFEGRKEQTGHRQDKERQGGRLPHEPFSAPDLTIDESRLARFSHSLFTTIPEPIDTPHLPPPEMTTPTSSSFTPSDTTPRPSITVQEPARNNETNGGPSSLTPIAADHRRHSYMLPSGKVTNWNVPSGGPSIGRLSTYSYRPSSAPNSAERDELAQRKRGWFSKKPPATKRGGRDGTAPEEDNRRCVVM